LEKIRAGRLHPLTGGRLQTEKPTARETFTVLAELDAARVAGGSVRDKDDLTGGAATHGFAACRHPFKWECDYLRQGTI
jgi:hypothetical protein